MIIEYFTDGVAVDGDQLDRAGIESRVQLAGDRFSAEQTPRNGALLAKWDEILEWSIGHHPDWVNERQEMRYIELSETMPDDEAYSTAYGVSVEQVRRDRFRALAAQEGIKESSFAAAVASYHASIVAAKQYDEAEQATRGHMVKREYQSSYQIAERVYTRFDDDGYPMMEGSYTVQRDSGKAYDPFNLWFANANTVRRYASEEMLRWFDENPRITRNSMLEAILAGSDNWAESVRQDWHR